MVFRFMKDLNIELNPIIFCEFPKFRLSRNSLICCLSWSLIPKILNADSGIVEILGTSNELRSSDA